MKTGHLVVLAGLSVSLTGCAFFNTFFNARKSYNSGVGVLKKSREQAQGQNTSQVLSLDRFSLEGVTPSEEAKRFFGLAIEKGNKVVVLHPDSKWVEDAILLMGKAHYLRGTGNDYYDAKNRFEVFMTRYSSSPMLPEAKLWYGKTLIKLRLDNEAREALRQVPFTTVDPNLVAESLVHLGDLSSAGASPDVALDYYRQAADQKCRSEIRRVALYKSAFVLYSFGRFEEAIDYAQKLSRQDLEIPERFDVVWLSSLCFKALGQHDMAIAVLDKVVGDLRYKSHLAQAEFGIADALRMAGRHREAETQFNHVIDTYKNPTYSGDSFYLLGTMNDTTSNFDSSTWKPQQELALKYYSIVQTRYGQCSSSPAAVLRLDHLRRLFKEHAAIRSDEILLHHARRLRLDAASMESVQRDSTAGMDSVSVPEFSALDIIRQDDYLKKYLDDTTGEQRKQEIVEQETREESEISDVGNQRLPRTQQQTALKQDVRPSIAELQNVRVEYTDLKEIVRSLKAELEALYAVRVSDSLRVREEEYYSRIASHYVSLADYYDQTHARHDSALFYYAKVVAGYPGSASEEQAYYSIARIHMKQRSAHYLKFFEAAYEKFPNGQLVSVAQRVLGIDHSTVDSASAKMREAENLIFRERVYDRSLQLLEEVARLDSGSLRTRALFTMGCLYEQKLKEPLKAFRLYNTVAFLSPKSVYAGKIMPKIEAFARQQGIAQDSMIWWTDSRYITPTVKEKKETTKSSTASTDTSSTASTRDSLDLAPLDSSQVRSILESLETEVDSTFLKRIEMDSTELEKESIKEEEENAEHPK